MYTPSKKYGIVKSKHYRAWLEQNIPLIRQGLDKAERFPIEVEIKVVQGRGFTRKSDIDNVNKAILDCLVKAEIIPDDNSNYVIRTEERFFPMFTNKSEAITVITYFEPEAE
jgi:Holliday junction resolvase RusA-like endonuclease